MKLFLDLESLDQASTTNGADTTQSCAETGCGFPWDLLDKFP